MEQVGEVGMVHSERELGVMQGVRADRRRKRGKITAVGKSEDSGHICNMDFCCF